MYVIIWPTYVLHSGIGQLRSSSFQLLIEIQANLDANLWKSRFSNCAIRIQNQRDTLSLFWFLANKGEILMTLLTWLGLSLQGNGITILIVQTHNLINQLTSRTFLSSITTHVRSQSIYGCTIRVSITTFQRQQQFAVHVCHAHFIEHIPYRHIYEKSKSLKSHLSWHVKEKEEILRFSETK